MKSNPFLVFVRKELYHILRDRWTTLILLGLPVLMLVLFGFAISTEVKNARIAIVDPSRDASTQAIIEKLRENQYFILDRHLNSPNEIEAVFREGKIKMVVVFSERFQESMLHTGEAQVLLLADGSDPNTASALVNYATNIILDYQLELMKTRQIPYMIQPEVRLLFNPEMKGAYNFVPGVMGMLMMLICAMMTSISIVREKEKGSMEVLLVSPMKPVVIILAKMVPYFLLSLINLTTILLIAVFIMNVPVAGSLFWLIMVSFLFIFVSLALGLFISTVAKRQVVALMISGMALMMPAILLSGMMFPIENMPLVLRGIAQLIPAKWFIVAIKNLMIKGSGVTTVLNEIGVLLAMGVFLVIASIKNFKIRLS